jgi:hypothetical protein
MKMNWKNVKKIGKGVIGVILVFIFMSSCFVKSKFDNPTDGFGGLLLEGLSGIINGGASSLRKNSLTIQNTPKSINEGTFINLNINYAESISKAYKVEITSDSINNLTIDPSVLEFNSESYLIPKVVKLSALLDSTKNNYDIFISFNAENIDTTKIGIRILNSIWIPPLYKTNQNICYNAGSVITCGDLTFPNQDADFQKGENQVFVGPTQNSTYTSDYSTSDNLSKLIWSSCSIGLSGSNCNGTPNQFTWDEANAACLNLNSLNDFKGYYGKNNWRLPYIYELRTILNFSISTFINTTYFPNNQSGIYWTASEDPTDPTLQGIYLDFSDAKISAVYKPLQIGYARCVADL